jgi:hypothetical protein
MANPFLGVVLHWLGGLASGSFYVPYKGVKKWSWETYWLVGGCFSWIICPWLFAYFMTNDLFGVLRQQSASTLGWTYLFGLLWGLGGLTYGLTMRFLGLSLGTGVALGYCAAFGTLVPPIFKYLTPGFSVFSASTSIVEIAKTTSGQVTLLGVGVCLVGIAIAAFAGFTKESEMPEAQKKKSIKEFNFKKGILVATFCGIMSACFAFALQAGKTINVDTLKSGYIHGAAVAGIKVADPGQIPSGSGDQFVSGLDPAALGLTLAGKLDFAGTVDTIETNSVFAGKIAATYASSTDAVGRRLATYAAAYETIRSKNTAASTNALGTIRGLSDFSEKEIAVTIANQGGNVVALQSRYGLWQGLATLPVLLLGGFTTNFIWCVLLNIKNKTGYQYLAAYVRTEHAHHGGSGGGEHGPAATTTATATPTDLQIPKVSNYLFSALAGTTWYFQFFFYTMGATQMGKYDFASWTLHMSSIIIFATMWGWIFHEWKGAAKKVHLLITGGIATLVLSTCVIGLGAAMNGGRSFHDVLALLFG